MKNNYKTPAGFTDYETYRNYDNRACEIVNNFLDSKLYPYFTKKFKRINNTEKQIQGIDCAYKTINDNLYACDEKAAVKWTNKKLTTHAFELQFINRAGSLQKGWFLAENQINNSYNLVYTDKINDDEGDFDYFSFTEDQIRELHSYIVMKNKIKQYLYSLGVSEEKMLAKCKEIRETDGKCDMGDIEKDGYRFSFSKKLPEKPINILIDRKMLDVLADITYTYENGAINLSIKK